MSALRTTETVRVRNALCGYWLSRLHTQALIDRDREQTLTSKMIAHSRKAVDEDGRLCFVFCFFFYTSLLPIKTDSFIHYFFARNNIQLRLYICCTPDPQQSLHLFIGPVATSHLCERFVPGSNARNSAKFLIAYAFAYVLKWPHPHEIN